METFKFIMQVLKNEMFVLGVSGVAGAIAVAMVEWDGWLQLLRKVTVGGLCAIYLSPLAVPLLAFFLSGLSVPTDNAPTLGGFIMGMVGIVIVEFFIHVFRTYSKIIVKQKNRERNKSNTDYKDDYDV